LILHAVLGEQTITMRTPVLSRLRIDRWANVVMQTHIGGAVSHMSKWGISTALVAIAALATVLVVSTSAISGHIALAQTNSGIDNSQSNSATGTCSTSGGGSSITNSCTATQTNTNTNTGGVH
jgi:hypothetical protein